MLPMHNHANSVALALNFSNHQELHTFLTAELRCANGNDNDNDDEVEPHYKNYV